MNVLQVNHTQIIELLKLKKELQHPEQAILCKCEKCDGVGFASDSSMIDENGYAIGCDCPCGGKNKKVDKLQITFD